jgi:hypothetical protein
MVLSEEEIDNKKHLIQNGSKKEIDLDKMIQKLPKMANGPTVEETEKLSALFLNATPEDGVEGRPTMWKLSQGLSAIARELPPRRSREIQEFAGALLETA